jgi:hypothetical protein
MVAAISIKTIKQLLREGKDHNHNSEVGMTQKSRPFILERFNFHFSVSCEKESGFDESWPNWTWRRRR